MIGPLDGSTRAPASSLGDMTLVQALRRRKARARAARLARTSISARRPVLAELRKAARAAMTGALAKAMPS